MYDSLGDAVIHVIAQEGRVEMLHELAAAGANLNQPNSNGEIPLEIAFKNGDDKMAQALIEAGADINAKFKDGSTLLHNLVKIRNNEMIYFALSKGAGFEQNRRGNSPLHIATQFSHTKVVSKYPPNTTRIMPSNKLTCSPGNPILATTKLIPIAKKTQPAANFNM